MTDEKLAPVELPGCPDGLVPLGRFHKDRRGRDVYDVVVLRAAGTSAGAPLVDLGAVAAVLGCAGVTIHGDATQDPAVRWVLEKKTRTFATVNARLGARAGVELARTGVVDLVARPVSHRYAGWERWRRTDAGTLLAKELDEHLDRSAAARETALAAAASHHPGTAAAAWLTDGRAARAIADRYGHHANADQLDAATALERVAAALPADDVALPVFAQRQLGATHALDHSSKLGPIGARLAALVSGDADLADRVAAGGADAFREAWEAAGVVPDDIACLVAVWNLPVQDTCHPAAVQVRAATDSACAAWLSLQMLRGDFSWVAPPRREQAGWVFVCEGSAVLREAGLRGVDVPVLRTGGVPNVAALRLLDALAAAGWRVAVGCDVEPRPLRATIGLLSRLGEVASPWRLDYDDIVDAPTSGEAYDTGAVPELPWSPELTTLLRSDPRRRTEEDRFEALVDDLLTGSPRSAS